MEKIIEYIKSKPIEVFIALLLIIVIYQQRLIKKEAESCQCYFNIDDIQNDIEDIKRDVKYIKNGLN